MKHDVTYGDLLKRIEALEAARPSVHLDEIDALRDERDQQAERASGLERELGSVRERLRIAEEKAEANQAAADTLKDLRCGKAVRLDDEELWLTCIAPTQIAKWQAAADTLERLRRDAHLGSDEGLVLWSRWTTAEHERVEAERDALAAKVADLQSRLTQCEAVVDAWAPSKPGEWVGADTLAELRRDAERWRWLDKRAATRLSNNGEWYWCVTVPKPGMGSFATNVDVAIEKEAKT